MNDRTILGEIRRVRHEISSRLGHDPRRIVDYYADLQKTLSARLVNLNSEAVRTFTGEQDVEHQAVDDGVPKG